MNASSLSEFFQSNNTLIVKNALISPFLPLRVFEPYVKIEKIFTGKHVSAGLAKNICVIQSGIGVQNVFNAVEALISTNCRNLIFIGSCGGIGRAAIGDILIADQKAVTGIHTFSESLEVFLTQTGVPFKSSRIYSVETVKDETEALIDNLEKGGYLGVDIETNVFNRTSASNAFNACALLYVTDIPLRRPFTERFTKEERDKIASARDTAVRSAVRFMEGLA